MFKRFDRFHLNSDLFPESTRKVFPTSMILRHGVLALGFKTDYGFFRKKRGLNIGLLNPEAADIPVLTKAARDILGAAGFDHLNFFKIYPNEFIEVLEKAYGMKREALHFLNPNDTHPTLNHFLSTE